MRITPERLEELQVLLKTHTGRDYSLTEAQIAGFAIMRFVLAKRQREIEQKTSKNNTKLAIISNIATVQM